MSCASCWTRNGPNSVSSRATSRAGELEIGQVASLFREELPVDEIMHEILDEYNRLLTERPERLAL